MLSSLLSPRGPRESRRSPRPAASPFPPALLTRLPLERVPDGGDQESGKEPSPCSTAPRSSGVGQWPWEARAGRGGLAQKADPSVPTGFRTTSRARGPQGHRAALGLDEVFLTDRRGRVLRPAGASTLAVWPRAGLSLGQQAGGPFGLVHAGAGGARPVRMAQVAGA